MPAERGFRIGLGVGTLVVVALQVISLSSLQSSLWGLHAVAFLPRGLVIAGWLVALIMAAWLLVPQRLARLDSTLIRVTAAPTATIWVPVVAIVSTALFWQLRSQQTVLGDALPLMTDLPHGANFSPRQPFSMALQQFVYRTAGGLFGGPSAEGTHVAMHTVALASVVAGAIFTLLASWLGRTLAGNARPNSGIAFLLTLVLLTQGYASLFYGYLETYAFIAMSFAAYLAAGLAFLRGRLPLVVAIGILLVTIGQHLSAIALLPSLLFLAISGVNDPARRRGVWRDLLVAIVGLVVLDRILARMSPGYSLWHGVTGILATASADQGGGKGLGYFFSKRHWIDFLNAQHLIGPLAASLFVAGLGFALPRRDVRTATLGFLGIAALTLLAASAVMSEPALGYGRDWDLFAPAGVAYTVAGLAFYLALVPENAARRRWLTAGAALSVLHLAAWVLLNHSETRSMQRFATLDLGLGRTQVVLGNWHYRNGRTAEAVTWFEKALRIDPRNSNAWAFLGQIEAAAGNMPRAGEAFKSATALRPDKALYRHNLVKALEAQGRFAETLPHYEILDQQEPYFVDNPLGWAAALRATGRDAEATAVLQRALQRFDSRRKRTPGELAIVAAEARLLGGLGRTDEALQIFDEILRSQPDSDIALYERGQMLVSLGRLDEARPSLQRLLQLYPQHPARDQVRAWLAQSGSSR